MAVTEMLTWVSDTTSAVKARVGGAPTVMRNKTKNSKLLSELL